MKDTSKKNWLLFSICLATLLINIELNAVTLILPQISLDLGINLNKAQWIISVYLLMVTVFIIIGGKLGDLFSNKGMIIFSLSLFTFSSTLGGISGSFSTLIIARALQGISAAIVVPNSIALIYKVVPDDYKGRALGLVTSVIAIGTSLGPLLGGALTFYINWRAVFLINLPLGLLTLGFIYFCIPEIEKKKNLIVDYKGVILLTLSLMSLVNCISNLSTYPLWITGLQSFFAVMMCYVLYIHSIKFSHPIINFSILKNELLQRSCFIRFILSFIYYNILYLLTLYLQLELHYSVLAASIFYMPMTLLSVVCSLSIGKFTDLYRVELPIMSGLILLSASAIILVVSGLSFFYISCVLFLTGIGYGVLYPSLFKMALSKIKHEHISEATGIFYIFNLLGGIIGITCSGMIMGFLNQASIKNPISITLHGSFFICFILTFFSIVFLGKDLFKKSNLKKYLKTNAIY